MNEPWHIFLAFERVGLGGRRWSLDDRNAMNDMNFAHDMNFVIVVFGALSVCLVPVGWPDLWLWD